MKKGKGMQVEVIKDYFTDLQQRIVAGLEQLDGGKVAFLRDVWHFVRLTQHGDGVAVEGSYLDAQSIILARYF